jgi:hypothetical protein
LESEKSEKANEDSTIIEAEEDEAVAKQPKSNTSS